MSKIIKKLLKTNVQFVGLTEVRPIKATQALEAVLLQDKLDAKKQLNHFWLLFRKTKGWKAFKNQRYILAKAVGGN